jgi:hypothetical protein
VKRLLNQLWIVIGACSAAVVVSWIIYMPSSDERGVWLSKTGRVILDITPLTATMYSQTRVSCVEHLRFPAHMKLVELAEGASIETTDGVLGLTVDGTLDVMQFDRIASLPATCGAANPNATATQVFDAFWHAMNDHYAFFDLHGVDWDARHDLRPDEASTLTDDALFALLSDALEGLDDGHVQLGTPSGYFSPAEAPDWWVPEFSRPALAQIARDTIGTPLTPIDLTGIEYALLDDGIGYVLLRSMSVDTPFGSTSQNAMALAFNEVATVMADARAIIIDLRYNPGGSDSVSFGVASHFTSTPLPVLSKSTYYLGDYTAPFTAVLSPYDDTPLDQPVIVLTSRMTGSAAEILTMALGAMPQVTTMGEPTSGVLSDIHGVKLPNGWDLGLSNQAYRTIDGTLYESIGIPPQVAFDLESQSYLDSDDPLLRAAFARARQN